MVEAYVMEKGTHEFYATASHTAHDEEAKKAFAQLAGWEEEHMDYIQFLYQAIRDEQEAVSFAKFNETVRPSIVEGAIPIAQLEEKPEAYIFLDDLGALTLALEIEGKACKFYLGLSDTIEDTSTKAFMKEMLHWEEEHIKLLKALRYRIPEVS